MILERPCTAAEWADREEGLRWQGIMCLYCSKLRLWPLTCGF